MTNIGYLSGNLAFELPQKINGLATTLTASDSPVFFTGYQTSPQGNIKFTYQFLGGRGNWGSGGTPVNYSQLQQLSIQNIVPEDLTTDTNANLIPLNEIQLVNFLSTVNTTNKDFTDTAKQHYISFTNSGTLFLKRFIGTPGEYGGTSTALAEADFEDVTNSNVKAGPSTAILQDILQSNSTVTIPIITKDNNTGSKISYKGSAIEYENANGFVTKINYEDNDRVVNYKIPAKLANDTFAMKSDLDHIQKPLFVLMPGESFDEISPQSIADFINTNVSFTISDTEIPPLVLIGLTEDETEGRIYFLINIGKGTYGLNGTAITGQNLIDLPPVKNDINDILDANDTALFKYLKFIDEWDRGCGVTIHDPELNTLARFSSSSYGSEGRQGRLFVTNSLSDKYINIDSDRIIFNNGNGGTLLKGGSNEGVADLTLPEASGTLATVNDIPDVSDVIRLSEDTGQNITHVSFTGQVPSSLNSETLYFIESHEFEGAMTGTSNGSGTTVSLAHNLGVVPSYCSVQAKNALASGYSFITADSTNIIIQYPATIAAGLPEYWIKFKK